MQQAVNLAQNTRNVLRQTMNSLRDDKESAIKEQEELKLGISIISDVTSKTAAEIAEDAAKYNERVSDLMQQFKRDKNAQIEKVRVRCNLTVVP